MGGRCLSQLTAMLPPGERPSMSPIAQRTVGHVPDAVDVGGLLLRSHRNRRVFGIEETWSAGVVLCCWDSGARMVEAGRGSGGRNGEFRSREESRIVPAMMGRSSVLLMSDAVAPHHVKKTMTLGSALGGIEGQGGPLIDAESRHSQQHLHPSAIMRPDAGRRVRRDERH